MNITSPAAASAAAGFFCGASNFRLSLCLAPQAQRLPLGEAVAKIGTSEPILVTDEGLNSIYSLYNIGENGARLSLIRLFRFALNRGKSENPPSPRGRLWCVKPQLIV